MAIPSDEKLRITHKVHAKWPEISDDKDDAKAKDSYFRMYEEAMAATKEKYKNRPKNS